MFQRLLELSRLLGTGGALWERLDEGMPERYTRGLALCFDLDGRFAGVREWSRRREVVYRKGPPNGFDLTPCSKLGEQLPKTLKRVGRSAANVAPFAPAERSEWWRSVAAALEGPAPELVATATDALAAAKTDADNRAYVFVARLQGMTIDPAFAWPECKDALVDGFTSSIGKDSSSPAGRCQVCGGGDREVFGGFNVLACYNLDKPGSIAGGFDARKAVRNLPVCLDCAVALSQAIIYAEANLSGWAAGLDYLVLPSTASSELRAYLLEEGERGHRRLSLSPRRDPLDDRERDLLSDAAELAAEGRAADLSFHFVFFESEKASWKITAEVRQVLPSRVAELHAASRALSTDAMLFEGKRDDRQPFEATTRTLADFASTSAKRDARNLQEWLVALLEGRPVDRRTFFHTVASALAARARKDPQYLEPSTRRAWGLVRFALMTGLVAKEEWMKPETPASCYGEYCAAHREFFTTQEHVAAFLTGCFASIVCYVQKQARGAAPFAKKFRGRLVDPVLLKRLYHEGRDRLEIYDGMGLAGDLDADLAQALVAVGDRWTVNNDELTLAFSIGLALQFRLQQSVKQAATAAKKTLEVQS